MCGICGIINFEHSNPVKRDEIIAMRDTMIHRGPDDEGLLVSHNIGLGHRRLSIIDLSPNGRQPMSNESGTVWICYNGEFYNYGAFIEELTAKGHVFRSQSDTEVIIHLYEEYGLDETLRKMTGMFAFALVDLDKGVSFLVRDMFGIKPLYFTVNKERIAFASEIKAFYKLHDYAPKLRQEALPEFFLYNRLLDFSTLLHDTFEVKPGCYLRIERCNIKEEKYYTLENIREESRITENEAVEEFDRLIKASIKSQLVSDVPLGVFLSGGIDSTIIALKASEMIDVPLNTISAGYEEKEANEFFWSDQVVKQIGSSHRKFLDNADDFFRIHPWLIYIYDAPLAQGVSFYKASQFAKQTCTVMLCGQGSDEIFGGYAGYVHAQYQNRINIIMHGLVGKSGTNLFQRVLSRLGKRKIFRKVGSRINLKDYQVAAAYASSLPAEDFIKCFKRGGEELYYSLLEKYSHLWPESHDHSFLSKMLLAEMNNGLQTIVKATDRLSMAASVETRVPFLDHHLVEFAFSLPPNLKINKFTGKYIPKKYLSRYFNKGFVYREKKGFPVPLTQWFLNEKTRSYFEIKAGENSVLEDIFNTDYFNEYRKIVESGKMGVMRDAVDPIIRYRSLYIWSKMIEEYSNSPQ
ncbi:MAG: asparagine synthase (glutamine-hydrolyzing) [Syntrophales bacterium]|jgi:asparagine synthase (glutamine-hydrolysing)